MLPLHSACAPDSLVSVRYPSPARDRFTGSGPTVIADSLGKDLLEPCELRFRERLTVILRVQRLQRAFLGLTRQRLAYHQARILKWGIQLVAPLGISDLFFVGTPARVQIGRA